MAEFAPADKWEAQLRKGCLELAVLASLWNSRLYGLEILRSLESRSRLIVTEGTVYPLLSRLRTEGVVDAEWVESESGHPRRYYWLTATGRERLAIMARFWSEFAGSLGELIKPVLNGSRMRGNAS